MKNLFKRENVKINHFRLIYEHVKEIYALFTNTYFLGLKMTQMTHPQQQSMLSSGSPTHSTTVLMSNDCKTSLAPTSYPHASVSPPTTANGSYYSEHTKYAN